MGPINWTFVVISREIYFFLQWVSNRTLSSLLAVFWRHKDFHPLHLSKTKIYGLFTPSRQWGRGPWGFRDLHFGGHPIYNRWVSAVQRFCQLIGDFREFISLNFSFTSYFRDWIPLILAFGESLEKDFSLFKLPNEANTCLIRRRRSSRRGLCLRLSKTRIAFPYKRCYPWPSRGVASLAI